MPSDHRASERFATFLQLERTVRHAETEAQFRYVVVNDTRRLIPFQQAVLVAQIGRRARVVAVSGVTAVERSAPAIVWLEKVIGGRLARRSGPEPEAVGPGELAEDGGADAAAAYGLPHILLCPLVTPGGIRLGALWLARDVPWPEGERILAEQLADAYGHAWNALLGNPRVPFRTRRWLKWLVPGLLVLAALVIRVPQSALAPVEIAPTDPLVVAAPVDGVIASVPVAPNTPVQAGDVLFTFEDTALRSNVELAEKALAVATAELRKASLGAFNDPKSSAQVALIEAQIALKRAELDYARQLLERVVVTASRPGIVVFRDRNDWLGRPVRTGERVMQIVDQNRIEARIYLPVEDALVLVDGAAIELFLDIDPLSPRPARLVHAGYEAEITPAGVAAYRLTGRFPDDLPPVRIGLKGTAKIYGERVPLMFYLLRRPLSMTRQALGF